MDGSSSGLGGSLGQVRAKRARYLDYVHLMALRARQRFWRQCGSMQQELSLASGGVEEANRWRCWRWQRSKQELSVNGKDSGE